MKGVYIEMIAAIADGAVKPVDRHTWLTVY